ncbi:MAG: hypothetical protein QOH28_4007, partial [Actinomycetota bacterium]|nr:hypothetical protein [Actinomycetota bacterium]
MSQFTIAPSIDAVTRMQVGIGAVVSTPDDTDFVVEAERLGATSVWVPEAWGQDALTPLAYLAARTTTIK